MSRRVYETFEHEADVGIRGFGKSHVEAFENGAAAMFSIMYSLDEVSGEEGISVEVQAPDRESLFVEWLNELLSQANLREMALSEFKINELTDKSLRGQAFGEKIDIKKHNPNVEVKGATYSMLEIKEKNGRYSVQCIVDV